MNFHQIFPKITHFCIPFEKTNICQLMLLQGTELRCFQVYVLTCFRAKSMYECLFPHTTFQCQNHARMSIPKHNTFRDENQTVLPSSRRRSLPDWNKSSGITSVVYCIELKFIHPLHLRFQVVQDLENSIFYRLRLHTNRVEKLKSPEE